MRFLIGERAKGNGCNIIGTNEWNLAVTAAGIYLIFLFNSDRMKLLYEVFCFL